MSLNNNPTVYINNSGDMPDGMCVQQATVSEATTGLHRVTTAYCMYLLRLCVFAMFERRWTAGQGFSFTHFLWH